MKLDIPPPPHPSQIRGKNRTPSRMLLLAPFQCVGVRRLNKEWWHHRYNLHPHFCHHDLWMDHSLSESHLCSFITQLFIYKTNIFTLVYKMCTFGHWSRHVLVKTTSRFAENVMEMWDYMNTYNTTLLQTGRIRRSDLISCICRLLRRTWDFLCFSIKHGPISNIESDKTQFKLYINELQVVWGGGPPNEPTFPLSHPLKGDCSRNSHESLGLKLVILATPEPPRERSRSRDQSISPVTLRNMSLCLLIRFRDNKWKRGLSGPFAFTNGSA